MRTLLLLSVLLLPACSIGKLVSNTNELIVKAQTLVEDAKLRYEQIRSIADLVIELGGGFKTSFEEARAQADTDGDGETSIPEWLAWVAGIGGPSGFIAFLLRRNKLSDDRKAALEDRLRRLEIGGS